MKYTCSYINRIAAEAGTMDEAIQAAFGAAERMPTLTWDTSIDNRAGIRIARARIDEVVLLGTR